jgi:hypothetical protein
MDNYYDSATGEWVTDWTRYQAVLAQARFASIADRSFLSWPPRDAFERLLELLAAVPDDTVHYVGSGPLEDLINQYAPEIIGGLEDALPNHPRLQRAVLEVNLTRGSLPSAIETRLVAAFGPQFQLLEPDAG